MLPAKYGRNLDTGHQLIIIITFMVKSSAVLQRYGGCDIKPFDNNLLYSVYLLHVFLGNKGTKPGLLTHLYSSFSQLN